MIFVEIKSTRNPKVREDFTGFFFSINEKEIASAHQLGKRHIVLLQNLITGVFAQTSVDEIASKSRSANWQISVQL